MLPLPQTEAWPPPIEVMQAGGQGQNVLTPDGKIWAIPTEDQSLGLQLPLTLPG